MRVAENCNLLLIGLLLVERMAEETDVDAHNHYDFDIVI